MKQISFAQAEHQNKKKVTRRERFLAQLEVLVPWQRLLDALSPSYFLNAAGKRGRSPIDLERMLRIYFLQQWYALTDEALEDAIYDSQAMRDFMGIDLAIESVPGATTLLRFLHLLEKHAQTQRIFEEINAHLAEQGLLMCEGTIVDATSANVADATMAGHLVRDDDQRGYGDAGYTGMWKHLEEEKDAPDSRCCVSAKRGAIKKIDDSPMKALLLKIEKAKASIRFMCSRTSSATGR